MADRVFIDTNVFIYAEDADQPGKRAVAQRVIQQLAVEQRGVISTQVLTEYIAVARRQLGLTAAQCRPAVLLMCQFDVVLLRPEHILGALDLMTTVSVSHWDALILKAAAAAGCQVLATEDLSHGQVIDGVRIENPFKEHS